MKKKLAFTVREAAEMLSISRTLMYELIQAGRIQSVKFGRSRRITEDQLRAFLDNHEVVTKFSIPNKPH